MIYVVIWSFPITTIIVEKVRLFLGTEMNRRLTFEQRIERLCPTFLDAHNEQAY